METLGPAALRRAFVAEQEAFAREAVAWMQRYNWSMGLRVQGYMELGKACRWAYPWPVVAILGICQVMEGESQMRLYGTIGDAAARLRVGFLQQIVDGLKDVLRRTNRGIFADSVPTVLYALRCHDLRHAGRQDLAEALIFGPLPPLLDAQSRDLIRTLYEGLDEPDPEHRFVLLSRLTLAHFEREQRIFSFHMGAEVGRADRRARREPPLARLFTRVRKVPAPVIQRRITGRTVSFKPYRLPPGFDMRDHEARVAEFGKAFVESVTRERTDYRAAVRYVGRRFGRRGERLRVTYPAGGTPVSRRS